MDALSLLEKKIDMLVQSLQELRTQYDALKKEYDYALTENTRLTDSIHQLTADYTEDQKRFEHEKKETKRAVDDLLARIDDISVDVNNFEACVVSDQEHSAS